jgi:hypothetical protein
VILDNFTDELDDTEGLDHMSLDDFTNESEVVDDFINISKEHPVPKDLPFNKYANIGVIFERMSNHITNESGDILCRIYYDKPVLYGDSATVPVINEFFEDEAHKYIYPPEYDKLVEWTESAREMIKDDKELAEYPLFNFQDMKFICLNINRNIISFKGTVEWMMGGVYNQHYYGYTFSLDTGELLIIDNYTNKNESYFASTVVQKLYYALKEDGWLNHEQDYSEHEVFFEFDVKEIKEYGFEDYNFYDDGENINIIFNYLSMPQGRGYILKLSSNDLMS